MSVLAAFQPTYGTGITETATTSSASYTLDPNATKSGGGNKAACVTNQGGTNGFYFRIGKGSQTATDADMWCPPNGVRIVAKAETDDQIAILAAASTTAVHAVVGEGLCIA